jgi:hypothetical protein
MEQKRSQTPAVKDEIEILKTSEHLSDQKIEYKQETTTTKEEL